MQSLESPSNEREANNITVNVNAPITDLDLSRDEPRMYQ